MKKLLLILTALVLLFGLIFAFSGCELIKNAAENLQNDLQDDAELAAKAVSDAGYDNFSSGGAKLITPTTYEGISGSSYESKITSPYTTFALAFTDHQVTVDDDNGNPVTVTLNGTVNFATEITSEGASVTFEMVVFSQSVSIKVGDDDLGNVPVDIYFYFSTSSSGSITANIEGKVGDYNVSTTLSGLEFGF